MPASILLVDDEPSILATLTPLLRSRGYQVHAVTTGQACLDALSRVTPDVVVLDLGLPDIDGVDVCRLVRAEHGVPILVLSARGGERDKVAALDARCRRLHHEAIRGRGTARPRACGRASQRRRLLNGADDRHQRSRNRSEPPSCQSGRRGDPSHAEGVRSFGAAGAAPGPCADPPSHLEIDMGRPCGRPAGALARTGGRPEKEDRTRSRSTSIHTHRAVGGIPVRRGVTESWAHRASVCFHRRRARLVTVEVAPSKRRTASGSCAARQTASPRIRRGAPVHWGCNSVGVAPRWSSTAFAHSPPVGHATTW